MLEVTVTADYGHSSGRLEGCWFSAVGRGGGRELLFVGCLTSQKVYLRGGSAQTILHAAILR